MWAAANYDPAGMTNPGGSTFVVPANRGGTWAIVADIFSNPGAPTVTCNLGLTTNPALQVMPSAIILAGQRAATLAWVGKLAATTAFSFNFYNGHPTAVTLQARMEARWLAF